MDIQLHPLSLLTLPRDRWRSNRKSESRDNFPRAGERGEIVLPFVYCLVIAGLLMGGLFWLSLAYESKTKEHLRDFQNRWNSLQKKYKD